MVGDSWTWGLWLQGRLSESVGYPQVASPSALPLASLNVDQSLGSSRSQVKTDRHVLCGSFIEACVGAAFAAEVACALHREEDGSWTQGGCISKLFYLQRPE